MLSAARKNTTNIIASLSMFLFKMTPTLKIDVMSHKIVFQFYLNMERSKISVAKTKTV